MANVLVSFDWQMSLLKYRKVASTSPSCLEAHAGFFRLFMKGKFDVYILWPFGKKVDFLIINTRYSNSDQDFPIPLEDCMVFLLLLQVFPVNTEEFSVYHALELPVNIYSVACINTVVNTDYCSFAKVNNQVVTYYSPLLAYIARTYLQPHYGNGVFGDLYLSAGQH